MEGISKKLYSLHAIFWATLLGGPVAAGALVKSNCTHLGRKKEGSYAFLTGIVLTLLVFVVSALIPEKLRDKLPGGLYPLLWTLVAYCIVNRRYGKELAGHKNESGEFHSVWNAVGIGILFGIVVFALLFVFALLLV